MFSQPRGLFDPYGVEIHSVAQCDIKYFTYFVDLNTI
jgi:hypothetical protein